MITSKLPVPVNPADAPKMADAFRIAHFDTSNRDDGDVLDVWWNALKQTPVADPTEEDPAHTRIAVEIVQNCGPCAFSGDVLVALYADALSRAQASDKFKSEPGVAYREGLHLAIYAALQAAKQIQLA